MRNKIIFLLPDLGPGGAERVVSILSKEIVKLTDYSVEIALLSGNIVHYEIDDRINVAFLNTREMGRFARIKCIREYLKKNSKQNKLLVVAFQDNCLNNILIAKCGLGIKCIASERNDPNIKAKNGIKKILVQLPYLISDYCVFQTDDARDYYYLVDRKKCSIIGNPITNSEILWKGLFEPSRLISVCRLTEQKNIPMTLDVISVLKNKYSDIKISIYGKGEEKETIENYISEKGLEDNVELCGVSKNVIEKMANSSIFVSTSNYEGISNSMLEAMSIGMPIICTDCPIGGARMMLSDGAGMLSSLGNVEEFANRLDMMLCAKEISIKMGSIALRKTELFSPAEIARKWTQIFDLLLARRD